MTARLAQLELLASAQQVWAVSDAYATATTVFLDGGIMQGSVGL